MTVSIPSNASPVSEIATTSSSVSVPSGEVWKVNISGASSTGDESFSIKLNDSPIAYADEVTGSETISGQEIVITGGDTISVNGFATQGSPACHISGFEVSSAVDNTAVSQVIGTGGSVDVPAGETWRVNIAMGSDDNGEQFEARINGETVMSVDTEYETVSGNKIVLVSGDTVTLTTTATQGAPNLLVSGFKL